MASIAISASVPRACTSHQLSKKKQHTQTRPAYSLRTKQPTPGVTLDVENRDGFRTSDQHGEHTLGRNRPEEDTAVLNHGASPSESCVLSFTDERWKNGTWDLNMFVKNGRMDWDGVIVAEAKRRKFLELYPEAATNQDPVLFKSSLIPWWAWLSKSYLPQAELLNGRAAMLGFFMAYLVDALTGIGIVGQSGNFICKSALFVTVIGVLLFRQSGDVENLKKLAAEATLYDKQWQASWQNQSEIVEQSQQN